jgi:hypothetical protein
VAPIRPATINFLGSAVVQRAGLDEAFPVPKELACLIPAERRASCSLITIIPEGELVAYGIGVSLRAMLHPEASLGHAPVSYGHERNQR